jgi:hypothetical protein
MQALIDAGEKQVLKSQLYAEQAKASYLEATRSPQPVHFPAWWHGRVYYPILTNADYCHLNPQPKGDFLVTCFDADIEWAAMDVTLR